MSGFYLFIGYRLARRKVSTPSRLAANQLAIWWGGLGVDLAIGGIELACALAGALTFSLAMTFYLVTVVVIVSSLWGLTGFLTYVYTGRYHLVEVCGIYVGFYVAYLFWFFSQSPYALSIEAGSTVWQYHATPSLLLELVLVVILLGPEIVGAILYLSLWRRTRDTAQRYRIALVGGGILLWFALDVLVPGSTIPWLAFRTSLLVIPAVMSLIAYFPPSWARRRYGATAIESQPSERVEGVPVP